MAMAVPLGGGHSNRPGQVLGIVTGSGENYPLLSDDADVAISPTQSFFHSFLCSIAKLIEDDCR